MYPLCRSLRMSSATTFSIPMRSYPNSQPMSAFNVEKVDYAIFKDNQIQVLIKCKKIGDPLDLRHASQLFRYFAVTTARIAILTDGQEYHVFTDGGAAEQDGREAVPDIRFA